MGGKTYEGGTVLLICCLKNSGQFTLDFSFTKGGAAQSKIKTNAHTRVRRRTNIIEAVFSPAQAEDTNTYSCSADTTPGDPQVFSTTYELVGMYSSHT